MPSAFHFPIRVPISNDRVKLVPFEPDLHATTFVAQTRDHPELFTHTPFGPFDTADNFTSLFFGGSDSLISFHDPEHFLFAIKDRTRTPSPEDADGELAGIIGFIHASEKLRSVEIGPVVVLPRYQRTHVTSNALGLLLGYAFTSLELVRAEWVCHALNLASIKTAERLAFERVGVVPYHFCFPLGRRTGKVGNGGPLPPGSDPDDLWRDTALYSLSWDLWARSREKVEAVMRR